MIKNDNEENHNPYAPPRADLTEKRGAGEPEWQNKPRFVSIFSGWTWCSHAWKRVEDAPLTWVPALLLVALCFYGGLWMWWHWVEAVVPAGMSQAAIVVAGVAAFVLPTLPVVYLGGGFALLASKQDAGEAGGFWTVFSSLWVCPFRLALLMSLAMIPVFAYAVIVYFLCSALGMLISSLLGQAGGDWLLCVFYAALVLFPLPQTLIAASLLAGVGRNPFRAFLQSFPALLKNCLPLLFSVPLILAPTLVIHAVAFLGLGSEGVQTLFKDHWLECWLVPILPVVAFSPLLAWEAVRDMFYYER